MSKTGDWFISYHLEPGVDERRDRWSEEIPPVEVDEYDGLDPIRLEELERMPAEEDAR